MSGLLPCDPTWEETGGAREKFGLFRSANSYSTRVIVWVSAPFLLEIVQLLI